MIRVNDCFVTNNDSEITVVSVNSVPQNLL